MIDDNLKNGIIAITKGCLIFNIIVFLITIILFFTNLLKIDIIYSTIGLVIGFIISVLYTYHMAISLNKSIDFPDEKSAQAYYTRQKFLRDGLVILFFIIISKFVNVTIAIFGLIALLGVKFGAYFSPIINKK